MVDIILKDGESGYDVIAHYIREYWNGRLVDTVLVLLKTSYNGKTYTTYKEVAYPIGAHGIEFLNDWWEGEKYIELIAIKNISEIEISGGLYT